MAKCTGVRCPMQSGYKVEKCNQTDCPYRTEPITNADRIRAMTDEELSKTFETDFATCPPNAGEDKWCDKDADCKQCWLDWLKQPAE